MQQIQITINPLDKLRIMLKEAGIPFTDIKIPWDKEEVSTYANFPIGPRDKNEWKRNQIYYGIEEPGVSWKFDAIYHFGSHSDHDVIECWGSLVGDEPVSITPEMAFLIIKKDWENNEQSRRE